MLTLFSEEESRAWAQEQAALYASAKLEDRVVAILMDSSIGTSGWRGETARAKAKAILAEFEKSKGAPQ